MKPTKEQVAAFLEELTAVSRKHGLCLTSCDHCSSMLVEPAEPDGYYRGVIRQKNPWGAERVQYDTNAIMAFDGEERVPW